MSRVQHTTAEPAGKRLHIYPVKRWLQWAVPPVQHTDLLKSLEHPNTYLVNSTGDPMQQSLSGLLLDGLPPSASAAFLPKTGPLLHPSTSAWSNRVAQHTVLYGCC